MSIHSNYSINPSPWYQHLFSVYNRLAQPLSRLVYTIRSYPNARRTDQGYCESKPQAVKTEHTGEREDTLSRKEFLTASRRCGQHPLGLWGILMGKDNTSMPPRPDDK
jgi:hypothetical protein